MTHDIDLQELNRILPEITERVRDCDYAELFTDFMPELASYEAGMFAGEFDSSGSPWAPLAELTVQRKGHDRILIESGALRESLVHIGGEGNISSTEAKGMLFGTDVEYAHFHQDGTSKMPARAPVGISDETLDKLCERIADRVVEVVKG